MDERKADAASRRPYLILVRHSQTRPDPEIPAAEWRLTATGRARCILLAEKLRSYKPGRFIASVEPKALETAQLAAAALGVPCESAPGLHEHERPERAWLDPADFQATIARLFAEPDQLVFGSETADQASARFTGALTAVLDRYPDQSIAVVTHATVLTLFAARTLGIDAFPFWCQLTMPAYFVLDRLTHQLVELVPHLD